MYLHPMKSVSILGCGWLGLPLGDYLCTKGYRVKGSTTQPDKLQKLKAAGIAPYHLVLNPELGTDPRDFFDADTLLINIPPRNRDGRTDFHQQQLMAIREAAKGQTQHIVFISSTAVYPANNQEVCESDASSSCLSRGGIALLEMEKLFTNDKDFETTVVRFGGLYGPDRHPGRFLAGKQGLSGGDSPINMIHLDDCIGVIHAILSKNIRGETLNACAPSQETRASFYQSAAKELGVVPPTFSGEGAPFKKVNADQLIRRTNYQFRH